MIGDYAFQNCSSLESISLGDGVTSIGHYSFSACSSLKSIAIPNSVVTVGAYAFYGCSSLAEVVCKATTPPTLNSDVFKNIASFSTLSVPVGCATAYSESDWASYFTTIEER